MEQISQAKLKLFRALQQKKYRHRHGLFLAEGFKVLEEAAAAGWIARALVVRTDALERLAEVSLRAEMYAHAPAQVFNRLSDQVSPEGILGVFELPEVRAVAPTPPRMSAMLLAGIRDPGNLGTLLRTAAWFGFRTVICDGQTVDAFSPKVVRASMGAVFHIPLIKVSDLSAWIEGHAGRVVAAAMQSPEAEPEPGRDWLLLGSESQGIPQAYLKPGVQRVTIPRYGWGESLNVGVAAGILAAAMAVDMADSPA